VLLRYQQIAASWFALSLDPDHCDSDLLLDTYVWWYAFGCRKLLFGQLAAQIACVQQPTQQQGHSDFAKSCAYLQQQQQQQSPKREPKRQQVLQQQPAFTNWQHTPAPDSSMQQ
jgi:hypothetical protein